MIIKRIGNFSIEEDEEKFLLHYSLSSKDWIDFCLQFFMSTFTLVISFAFLYSVYFQYHLIQSIMGVVFAIFGLWLLFRTFSIIIRVRRNIVKIIKKEHVFKHRNTLFSSKKYNLSDIKKFLVLEKQEQAYVATKHIRRIFSVIEIQLKDNSVHHLLIINTKNIFRVENDSFIIREVMNTGDNIVKEFNRIKRNII